MSLALADLPSRFGTSFVRAPAARNAAHIGADVHPLLCAALLAGGEDPESLPDGLATAVSLPGDPATFTCFCFGV